MKLTWYNHFCNIEDHLVKSTMYDHLELRGTPYNVDNSHANFDLLLAI